MSATDPSYFERLYAMSSDPWGFASRWYEARKYALTLAALPEPHYHLGFEPGCSIGVLSAALAGRCERLVCSDLVDACLVRARERVPSPHVSFERRTIPDEWPDGAFDLVVLSEIAYYFDRSGLETVVEQAVATTVPGASLVAVHWRGATDYPLTGDEAHAVIGEHPALERRVQHMEEEFVLELWTRRP